MWQYELGDYDLYRSKLREFNWDECFASDDINVVAQAWTDTLISIARECIPNKMVTVRPWDKPFYNGYLRRLRRAKDRAHRLAKYDNTPEAWETFRNHRRYYCSEIKRLKTETQNRLLNDINDSLASDPRKWWRLIKRLSKNKSTTIPALEIDGNIISGDNEKAQAFNNYFIECSTLDDTLVNLPDNYDMLTQNNFEHLETRVDDVQKYLSQINTKKASGPDGVNPLLLKEGANQLAIVLCRLFNMSLNTGEFPRAWKLANVIPLYKKNERTSVSNYRPVSVLSSVGKVLERLVFNALFDYFRNNFLISVWQSGFIPGHSTVTHLVEMYHEFCRAVSEGKEIRIVFCDVSRAFDRVWHRGLLFKLHKCGITGSLLTWLTNYLSDRYQRVVLNGQFSSWMLIQAGVPQGSVLGPLLFLIFINDITYVVKHCQIRMFADDTSLFIEVDDRIRTAELIEQDLEAISAWAKSWLVKFSPPKTESLIISNKSNLAEHPPIHMDGSALKEVTHHKHVGIILSRDLSWHNHICSIEKKARSVLNRLSQFKYTLDRRSLERVYMSNIRPIMEYGDVIWAGGNQTDLERLDMIQKDAARVVTGATARCSTELLSIDVSWPSLQSRRRYHRLHLFYKIVNGLSPPYLRGLLPVRVADRARYALRTSINYTVPMCKTNSFARSFLPYSVNEWNRLDPEVRGASNLQLFKSKCSVRYAHRNYLFYNGSRPVNIQMARMRIGCSSLRSHLCHNLHVEDNPTCQCGISEEDCEHYFFHCPLYADQRRQLFRTVDQTTISVSTILRGDENKSIEENILSQDAIHQFIIDTGRFQI